MCTESDVLVIGGGIAGITAAIEAARAGAATTIACAGPLFGGSSFYPGTWGLGLIGSESEADEADLIATIEDVGCGMADHELVEVFVRGIRPATAWLEEDLGVPLKRPSSAQSASDKTFIPCFDHKRRLWRGITRQTFEAAAQRTLKTLDVNVFERTELMELARLHEDDGAVCGAVFFDHASASLRTSAASSVILAAGGTGGLFERSLTSADVLSSVHAIAMSAGCELVNIEFMQMMPGLVSPVRSIVFNEKTFRYAIPEDASGILPHSEDARADLLEARSSHGPFTCRLDDERVDRAIDAAGPSGMPVRFRFPSNNIPEFVQTFSTWMQQSLNIAPTDELRIAMYAHAANGGIRIDRNAWTGVKGLYACGELTGGMHGADRIGGLSTRTAWCLSLIHISPPPPTGTCCPWWRLSPFSSLAACTPYPTSSCAHSASRRTCSSASPRAPWSSSVSYTHLDVYKRQAAAHVARRREPRLLPHERGIL